MPSVRVVDQILVEYGVPKEQCRRQTNDDSTIVVAIHASPALGVNCIWGYNTHSVVVSVHQYREREVSE